MTRSSLQLLFKVLILCALVGCIVGLGYWQIKPLVLWFMDGDSAQLWRAGIAWLVWCGFLLLLILSAIVCLVVTTRSREELDDETDAPLG